MSFSDDDVDLCFQAHQDATIAQLSIWRLNVEYAEFIMESSSLIFFFFFFVCVYWKTKECA